jgi:hypothetical protein|tara:strand:+ start:878 stop:1612 length:735 start_codon:yes stop_codon:yes gene_type:complete
MKKKSHSIYVGILCFIAFILVLAWSQKVYGHEDSTPRRFVVRLQIIEKQLQDHYKRLEIERDRHVTSMNKELEEIHDTAEELRQVMCGLGATTYCPHIPENLKDVEPLSFDFIGGAITVGTEFTITVTSYNPEVGQTDGSPCIGASNKDICAVARGGAKIMALSRDLVGRAKWKPFRYGDYVLLEHENPKCSGVFRVEDTMALETAAGKSLYRYGDIFYMERGDNHGTCLGVTVKKVAVPDFAF